MNDKVEEKEIFSDDDDEVTEAVQKLAALLKEDYLDGDTSFSEESRVYLINAFAAMAVYRLQGCVDWLFDKIADAHQDDDEEYIR